MFSIINIWPWELPDKIEGIAVVIDLWAATTNIAQMLTRGAQKILIVNEKNILSVIKDLPEALTVGESTNPEFDRIFYCSNAIDRIAKLDLNGKTVIYMTNNGTRVIEQALGSGAKCVITAAYINLVAAAGFILKKKMPTVILPAGEWTEPSIRDKKDLEDYLAAVALQKLLSGQDVDWESYFKRSKEFIKTHYSATRKKSLEVAHSLNLFPVVPVCRKEGGSLRREASRIYVKSIKNGI